MQRTCRSRRTSSASRRSSRRDFTPLTDQQISQYASQFNACLAYADWMGAVAEGHAADEDRGRGAHARVQVGEPGRCQGRDG